MSALVWLPPLVRALSTGLLVVSASAIAEALGPFWGALIASLPVSAGPAYVFLAMQHGADFIAASALSSFTANAATGLFLICYGVLSGRCTGWASLGTAVLVWLAASLAAHQIAWSPLTALGLNLGVYGIGFALLDAAHSGERHPSAPAPRRQFDLAMRAVAVAVFVSLVVTVSTMLGPDATGFVAVFPISLISLFVIVRPRIGGAATSLLAAHALRSMLGFGVMLLVLHLAVRPWGATAALAIALLVPVLWSGLLLVFRDRLAARKTIAVASRNKNRGRHFHPRS
jgi:small-conductance mechanosensitive channel